MSVPSLTTWMRDLATRDALLTSWRQAPIRATTAYETEALVWAALAGKTGNSVTLAIPGGRARLPLLSAVHAATLRLARFPSPFSGRPRGPAALVTRQTIRRQELRDLDAAGVRVSPALHSVRLRADGRVVSLSGGRSLPQNASQLLLLVGQSAGLAVPTLPPSTVIIDATDELDSYAQDALAWAAECDATAVLFSDVARGLWPVDTILYPCGWSAILAAEPTPGDPLAAVAALRGHAAVLRAGARTDLASVAVLLADARRHGTLPAYLFEAGVLARRLGELVVPLATYDAACPRWHTPTLSERLDDLAAVRAADFPPGFRTWAEACWATVKEGLASARDALKAGNPKQVIMTEGIDVDLRAGRTVDVALPSRTARDALVHHLAEAGVPIPADGRLGIRSITDATAWSPVRATMLAAPTTAARRHRMTAGDVGPLNVICYDHEINWLRRSLEDALDEPQGPHGSVSRLLPAGLDLSADVAGRRPPVFLGLAPVQAQRDVTDGASLVHLVDAVEIAGLEALAVPDQAGPDDLSDTDSPRDREPEGDWRGRRSTRSIVAVPLAVVAEDGTPLFVHVPAQAEVLRVIEGRIRRLPALEITPGMLLTGLDGTSPFDRLRVLLLEARGPVARLMMAAWDQALNTALRLTGGPDPLARAISSAGGQIEASAVRQWSEDDRIGPRDPENVARVGRLSDHPVVTSNSAAIAAVMRAQRALHQAVGRAVAGQVAVGELEELLGPDAASIVAEIVIFRVKRVDSVTNVRSSFLFQLTPESKAAAAIDGSECDD